MQEFNSPQQIDFIKNELNLEISKNTAIYGWDASNEILKKLGLDKGSAKLILNQIHFYETFILSTMQQRNQMIMLYQSISLPESELLEMDLNLLEKHCNRIRECESLFNDLEKQIAVYQIQVHELRDRLESGLEKAANMNIVKETFPPRTQAMVHTLQILKDLRMQSTFGPAFMIGGAEHLITSKKNISVDEYNLDPLYRELQFHNAIIMIPKVIANYYS